MELTTSGKFSIFRDLAQISAGTHFWCKSCVVARELFEQAENKDYCKSCWQTLKAEGQQTAKKREALVLATQDGQQPLAKAQHAKSVKVTRK
jgi:hypothetical protein